MGRYCYGRLGHHYFLSLTAMLITIATISILAITGLTWLSNRILSFKICPICAGVAGTWVGLLAAKFLGYEVDMIIPAMLMGGSIVGMAYQIEKRLPDNRSSLLWKTLFIPVGFVAVYSIISSWWLAFIVATAILVIWVLWFSEKPHHMTQTSKAVAELKEKMKNCC